MKKGKILRLSLLAGIAFLLVITGMKGEEYLEKTPLSIFAGSGNAEEYQAEFDTYMDNLFRQEVCGNTINLHYTLKAPENYGISEYTITYGSINEESRKAAVMALENIHAALGEVKVKKLTLPQQMTYDILMKNIETQMSATDLYYYQEVLRPSTGIQAELPVLMAEYTFYDEKDVQDYLALLQQTPAYFKDILLFEMEKANNGLFMPEFAAEEIISQCRNFIAEKENNYLLDTFNDKIEIMEGLTKEKKDSYIAQNKQAVLESVIPAYETLIQGMEKLKRAGQNQQGLCYLPRGKEYYEYLVKSYTGSDMSVEEMIEHTARQRNSDMAEAARLIGENPDLLAKTTSYVGKEQEPTIILQELQQKMLTDFPKPPDTNFTIKYVHPSLEKHMAPAFYLSVPIDDISQNSIYINSANGYQDLKLYTTLAHEGFPGHLYQNIMERSQNFSPIRSLLGTSGYSEGWATYVEMISYTYADMDEKLAFLLQKDQSALLSLYATADMGIHYQGWSMEDMMSFFGEYQITDEAILTNIYQLIVEEPAHYLKYYIGYLEFLKLREYARDMYGDSYSDYKFHEALMKMGPAQFEVLKKYLPHYYNEADIFL